MEEYEGSRRQVGAVRRLANAASQLFDRLQLSRLAGSTHGGDRNLYDEFGYERRPTLQQYLDLYLRDPVARRINDAAPLETWRKTPRIAEFDEKGKPLPESKWETTLQELFVDTGAWPAMRQVDIMAGLGQYAVLLIGSIRSGRAYDRPLNRDRIRGPNDLGYFRSFLQLHATIKDFDVRTKSKRFGQPDKYTIRLLGSQLNQGQTRSTKSVIPNVTEAGSVPFHWSRLVHVADNTLGDNVLGRSRLEIVLNVLQDMQKLWGSAAESYWRNVAGLLHANVDPQVMLPEVDPDTGEPPLESLKDELLEIQDAIERVAATYGVEIKHVGGGDPDPRGVFSVLRSVAAAGANMPQRILFGSERGELASTNDRAQWLTRIEMRQTQYAEGTIIRPTVDRLIEAKFISPPEFGYGLIWENLFELTEKERAEIARIRATAASEFARARRLGKSPYSDIEEREALDLPRQRPPEGDDGTISGRLEEGIPSDEAGSRAGISVADGGATG